MNKALAILYERRHADRLLSEAKEELERGEVSVVTINVPLFDNDLPIRESRDYLPEFYEESSAKKAQLWIKEWSNTAIVEGKTLKEIVSYDGVSLWWFVEFYYFYALYVSQIVKHIELLKVIVAKEKPTKIVFVKDGSLFSRVLDVFAYANKIETLEIANDLSSNNNIKIRFVDFLRIYARNRWKLFLTIKESLRSAWTSFLNLAFTKRSTKIPGSFRAIIVIPERFWLSIIDPETGKTRKGFVLVDSVIKKLAERNQVILVSVDPLFDKLLGFKILLEEKREYPNVVVKTPASWETKEIRAKTKHAKKKLDSIWEELKKSEDFQSSLSYEGIPLWSILEDAFSSMFVMALPEAVRWIENMKAMINKEKASVLVLPGEYCSLLGSAAIIAGKKMNVPTLAILHGVITGNSLEYLTMPNEKGEDANSKLPVIPTRLAVYGPYTKRALETLSYPSNAIVITGHPDYDVLFGSERLLRKEEILKEIGVDHSDRRIITFTAQALWSMKTREDLLRAVLEAAKDLQGVTLLIKPHPAEKADWHRKIVREMGVTNATVLDSQYATAKALFVCDLMITSSSTTAMEAMALNKPVITMNLEGKGEFYPYAKSGAAIGVYTSADILGAIKEVFSDGELREKLARSRRKFLSEHLYKPDGRASERISDLVSKMALKECL